MSTPVNERAYPASDSVTRLKSLKSNLDVLKKETYCGPILAKDKELGQKYRDLEEVVDRRLKEVGNDLRTDR